MNALYKISAIVIALFVICGCENNHTDQIDSVSYQIVYENNTWRMVSVGKDEHLGELCTALSGDV